MIAITYIEDNGTEHRVEVEPGMTLMEGATLNMVPGVLGLCGGICSCATCHCYLPLEWKQRLGAPQEQESAMLEGVDHAQSNSRLGCQVVLTPEMDGMTVRLPPKQ